MLRVKHTLLALAFMSCSSASFATPAKNVILVIGDGMDDQQITIARNYLKGPNGLLNIDKMPVRGSVSVLTVDESDPKKSVFVADSANTASTIATGIVTSRGRISTYPHTNETAPTIMELAATKGLATGIVSTASVTDATPAAFLSHSKYRGCENPGMMAPGAMYYGVIQLTCDTETKDNGGSGSISEQLVDSGAQVILGGGMKHFNQLSDNDGKHLLDKARNNGFSIATSPETLATSNQKNSRLLGLFSPSTMPALWRGENDRKAEYIKDNNTAFNCEPNPAFNDLPTLKDMTNGALLSLANNQSGFILMVESASIDKQSHARNPCGHIGEMKQLDDTLEFVLNFADKTPNTLVLVTADHGHAAQIIPAQSLFSELGASNHSAGRVALVNTPSGEVMAINYATNEGYAEEHTGVQVPIYGNILAEELVTTQINQPDLFL